jgi:MinD-like ATPase involved in chromosome partitioning or flagellar assembly
MSSIVTFYSYKGGVGRSMALANIAVLLAQRGLRVLTVDWDLEAPGLDRYFGYFDIKPGGPGLLRMLMEARDSGTADFRNFTSSFDCKGEHPITFLASGREQDEAYSRNLENFDWQEFFDEDGGQFVEQLRQQWRDEFDIVLIDSRTGLTDSGGICTIQIPDIVVAMFTANYQSLYGVRDVMRLAQKARQGLAYDRMAFSVLPLPARWGVHEFQETLVWLDRITEAVQEFYQDWLPRTLRARDVVESIKIPQADYFGFGEKLAVVEQGTTDPQGMGFVYDKVASFLASDFTNLSALVGEQALREANRREEAGPALPATKPPEGGPALPVVKLPQSADYLYDIFVSHDFSMSEWVLEFVEALKAELAAFRGGVTNIFVDVREIEELRPPDEQPGESLTRSKVLVAIVTPRYFNSEVARTEFLTFRERSQQTEKQLLAPVVLGGDDLADFAEELQQARLKTFSIAETSPKRHPAAWRREIMRLAADLNSMIDAAPPYDPQWERATEVLAEPAGAGPKAAVFLSYSEADTHAIFDIAEKISRRGAALFLDSALIRRDPESHILDALSFADEVLLLITPTRTDYLKEVSPPAFLDRRFVWLAIGTAFSRGIPIRGLLVGVSRKEVFEDQAIPTFIKEGQLFDTLESYLADLLRRTPRARPKTTFLQPVHHCRVCLCQGGRNASFLDRIGKRLDEVGILSNRWNAHFNLRADNFDAAVVVLDGKASPDWRKLAFAAFLQAFFDLQKPVAFVTLPGPSQTLPGWFQPAWRVEYRPSSKLSFLQLVWAIVGYQQYNLGIDEKPAISKQDKPVRGGDRTRGRERRPLPGHGEPLRVFISYSHKDERLRRELETHLKLLQRQDVIALWTDHKISAGEEWKGEINESLESADIILLLVSADFLASDYCYDAEMKRALERRDAGEARVIPIILREAYQWQSAPFGELQALPTDGRPVMSFTSRDQAWSDVAVGIREVAEQIRSRKS